MSHLKMFTSAWEAHVGGLRRIRLDDSVLDQILRGASVVHWEIEALLDQGLVLEMTPAGPPTSDLELLRQVLRQECEVQSRSLNDSGTQMAFWSFGGTAETRARSAELFGMSLYEPQIVLHLQLGPVTGDHALAAARRIGAISSQPLTLIAGSEELLGLH